MIHSWITAQWPTFEYWIIDLIMKSKACQICWARWGGFHELFWKEFVGKKQRCECRLDLVGRGRDGYIDTAHASVMCKFSHRPFALKTRDADLRLLVVSAAACSQEQSRLNQEQTRQDHPITNLYRHQPKLAGPFQIFSRSDSAGHWGSGW